MEINELRLRCIEAAARYPAVHNGGWAEGVKVVVSVWFDWIVSNPQGGDKADTLHLPGKKK